MSAPLGVTSATLSRWEAGERAPNPDELVAWAGVLGLAVEIVDAGGLDHRHLALLLLARRALPKLPDVMLDALAGMLKPYDTPDKG